MCLNREQTERRMLQMSFNVDMMWYIKRMGHLWANIHPPGPAIGIYCCIIDLLYWSGERARKPCVWPCSPVPPPAHLSQWKHPVPSHDAQFLSFAEWGVPVAKCSRLLPSARAFVANTPQLHTQKKTSYSSVPPRLVLWDMKECCTGSHKGDLNMGLSFCWSCMNPVLKYDLKTWKSHGLKLTLAEGHLI